jgi:hypothetical protein
MYLLEKEVGRSLDVFSLPVSFSCTVAPGFTQPLNRNEYKESSLGVKRSWHIRLTASVLSVSRLIENVEALTSHNPMSLHSLLQG